MKHRFRRRILYTLLLFIDRLFLLIPYRLALSIGESCGRLAYITLSKYRSLTKNHLRFAFGRSKTENEISKIAEGVFANLGIGLAEVLSLPKIKDSLSSIIDIKGREKIDNILKEGKGAIVVTAHFGNWELLPMIFAKKGYPANVVARPIYYEKYNEWVSFLRSSMGVNVIYRTDSPKKLLALLKRNELLGIISDQDIDSIEGVFVDFFGQKAYTPSAPVKLSLVTGAPIVPMFIVRNRARHTIFVEEPIRPSCEGRDKEAAVLLYTQRWSDVVESYIKKYPEQWVWMHKRWKTTPESQKRKAIKP